MRYLFLIFFLTGCAWVEKDPAEAGKVAAGTVAVVKTVEKIKEVFTPKYPLIVNPAEICDITKDPVQCFVVPCHPHEGECETHIPYKEFLSENPKVVTISASLVVETVNFCNKNPKACEKFWGQYKNQKIILTKEEEP